MAIELDIINALPEPPAGVKITPFKDYKNGLLVDSAVEKDASGTETIALPKKRPEDKPKTKATNHLNQAPPMAAGVRTARREWSEDWKDLENQRFPGGYNPCVTSFPDLFSALKRLYRHELVTERVRQAARNFASNRTWPNDQGHSSGQSIRNLWDQVRLLRAVFDLLTLFQIQLFLGLLQTPPVWKKATQKADGDDADADDDMSDADETPEVDMEKDFRGKNVKKQPKPRPFYDQYGKTPTVVHTDEEIGALLQQADAERNEKLFDFCEDPEKSITVFLSSYLIEQGLI